MQSLQTPTEWLDAILDNEGQCLGDQHFKYLDEPRVGEKTGLELLAACCEILLELKESRRARLANFPDSILFVQLNIANQSPTLPVWNSNFWNEIGTHPWCSPSLCFSKNALGGFSHHEVYKTTIPVPGYPDFVGEYYATRSIEDRENDEPFEVFIYVKLAVAGG